MRINFFLLCLLFVGYPSLATATRSEIQSSINNIQNHMNQLNEELNRLTTALKNLQNQCSSQKEPDKKDKNKARSRWNPNSPENRERLRQRFSPEQREHDSMYERR